MPESAGVELDEQLQAFCAKIGEIQEHARYVAARTSKAFDPSAGHRIALKINRYYRNIRSGASCRLYGGRASSQDRIHAVVHQIGCQS